MCFSAEANIVAGLIVSAVGVDALRHVGNRRRLPLALLPLVFGVHQLFEVFVWRGLDGDVPASVLDAAVWLYLVVAFGVLPWLVGVALAGVEPDGARRRLMLGCAGAGVLIAGLLAATSIAGSVSAEDAGFYVDYHTGMAYGGQLAIAYVAVTCLPLLLSSHHDLMVFGAVNLVVVTALTWLVMGGVISLWCGWAAVTSTVIAHHLRTAEQPHRRLAGVGHPSPAH
jgi:hypothetical protein